ncbi:MAG: PEP-utilizing enzyme [bacterium]
MKIPYNKEWILLEREDYANYLFITNAWEGYSRLPKKWGFFHGRFMGAEYIDSACNLFMLKDLYDKTNKKHFEYLFTKPKLWDNLHKITIQKANELFKLAKRIKKLNELKLSNKELLGWINSFLYAQTIAHLPRIPIFLLETPNNLVTNYLTDYLQEKAEDIKNTKTKPSEAFQIMIAPLQKSNWTKEKEELAKIGLLKNKQIREQKLKEHAEKYEWLEYGLQGKILSLEYFENELEKMAKKGCRNILKQINNEFKDLSIKQKKIIEEYSIHKSHQRIFKIVQDSMHTRLYSKDAQYFSYYAAEKLLKETGRRYGLSLEQTRFLAKKDFTAILLKNKNFKDISLKRPRYSLHITDKGTTIFYLGAEAKKIREKIKFYSEKINIDNTEILKGQPAYNGKVRGRVKIINTIPEIAKIHQGNILVSHMTNPGIVPAMKQAAAIVTDLGGITCHAAIVSRELKKPCVIGTRIATQILKDGDMVEVDADKGEIRVVK